MTDGVAPARGPRVVLSAMSVPLSPAHMTRREALVLGAAAGVVATVGAPAGALAAGGLSQGAGGPEFYTRATYVPLVGEDFAAGPHTLRLTSITDVLGGDSNPALRDHPEVFALEFEGPADALDHDIHVLTHPLLGPFPIFLGPVGAARGLEQTYAVIVDRSIRVKLSDAPAPDPSLVRRPPAEDPAPKAGDGGGDATGPPPPRDLEILEERRITALTPLVQRRRRARRARRKLRNAHAERIRFKRKQRDRLTRTRSGWLRRHGR